MPRTTLIKDNSLLCIGDVIRALLPISSAVPVLLKVLQLSVTFGVGSAGCERSFSSLARIKTKLRSTMGEGRLTNLAVLSIERELSGALDINAVIDRFRSRTEIAFKVEFVDVDGTYKLFDTYYSGKSCDFTHI